MPSLEKCLFRYATHFFIIFFIELNELFAYFGEINLLLLALVANILSSSVSFLFVLLAEQAKVEQLVCNIDIRTF